MVHRTALILSVSIGALAACAGPSAPVLTAPIPAAAPGPLPTTLPPPDPQRGSCAAPRPEWIWCDDFETDRLSSYFEVNTAGGRFTRGVAAGYAGSSGMAARYSPGQSTAGSLSLAFGKTPDPYIRPVDGGTRVYREVYWRWYIMHPATWQGGGSDKMTRAISLVTSQWAEAMLAHVWSGGPGGTHLLLDPASGTDVAGNVRTTKYNDFDNLRWIGSMPSAVDIYDAAHLGRWMCVEAHARLNDPGESNGVFELWINELPEALRTGLNWVGSYQAYGINAVFFENYWNASSPVEQTRYWDNIVVSTARIGCG